MNLSLILATLFFVNEPVLDMREEPSTESRIASQAFFAEEVVIKDQSEEWLKIQTSDGYLGWMKSGGLVERQAHYAANLKTSRLKAHLYNVKDTEYGPVKSLPYDSKLCALDTSDPRWIFVVLPDGKTGYIQKGDVTEVFKPIQKSDLAAFALKFLDLPYTWGGRSSFGYDCSGLIQMLYGQLGIALERDSKQQCLDARFKTIPIEALESGDLIFFGKSPERIGHVGMYIGEGQFIHANVRENRPWICISSLSDEEWNGNINAYYPYRLARQLR